MPDSAVVTRLLRQARESHAAGEMADARDRFLEASRRSPLSIDDRLALADASWWLGRNDEALSGFEATFEEMIDAGFEAPAAKLALDIAFLWMLRGETTIGAAWLRRGRRLISELPDCAERGYGLALEADEHTSAGRYEEAIEIAGRVQSLGHRFGDGSLVAIGLVAAGTARIRQGSIADGMASIDEAMIPVAGGRVSPEWVGNIYCQLMGLCHDLGDLRRAWEWTETTERWCAGFSSAAMFLGVCRTHRAQLLWLRGRWDDAEAEAVSARDDLADLNVAAAAESWYQIGEVRRVRGDLAGAEEAYRRAHRLGREPQPGLALVRARQGRDQAALRSLQVAVDAGGDDFHRARLLHGLVEVAVAAMEPQVASESARELVAIADRYGGPWMTAAAFQAEGSAALAGDHPHEALPALREAIRRWTDIEVPYEAARVRLLVAEALRALGDEDGAELELDAACETFHRLGAVPDHAAADRQRRSATLPQGLTAREGEVLSCVAAGFSNREVATTLFIAEKTVARHLSNIFTKIGVSSRTEAAAFAHRHRLVSHRRA